MHAAPPKTKIRRQRRARQSREGIVMLVVMLMLLMATGSAMFAMQSTQFEQRAATSMGESSWARGVAECTTMAAIAFAENTNTLSVTSSGLGTPWLNGTHSLKFALPAPDATGDTSGSMSLQVPPFVPNLPNGLMGFLPGDRCPGCAYPMAQRYDSSAVPVPGLHYDNAHWLMETITVPITGGVRFRSITTGFAELLVWGDSVDSGNQRQIHEVDAISRGYIDRITPNPI